MRKRRKFTAKPQRAERNAAASRRPSLQELGGTGLRVSGGKITEEYNPDLKGVKLYDEYDRMLRSHGQVQAVELVITLPIESLEYRVDPNKAGEPIDLEIADTVATNLFEGMTCTWEDCVSEIVMAALLGCNFLEKVYEIRDGQTWLRKLAPRPPRTIQEWVLDDTGGLQGIVQRVTNPRTGMSQDKPIGIDALLRFTYRGRSGNPEGIGLMRPMRTHWHIVQALWNIANVGYENFYNPTVVGMLPQGATASDEERYLAILRYFNRGITVPPGYQKPEPLDGGSRTANILGYIQYHDTLILRSALAQFLQLGSGERGSWALSDSHVTLFLLALEQIVKRFMGVLDRYLIPEYVGYRFPGVNRFPHMGWSPLAHVMQRAALLDTLQALAQGQLIERDDDIEGLIRNWLGLPEKTQREEDDSDTEETIPQDDEDVGANRRYRQRVGRELVSCPTCGKRHDPIRLSAAKRERQRPRDDDHFNKTDKRLNAAKTGFEKDMKELVQRQHAELKKKVEPIIEDIRKADDLSKGTHLRKLENIEVPLLGKYEALILQWQRDFYSTAVAKAAEAAGIEPPTTIPNVVRTWFAEKARAIARSHAERLRGEIMLQVLEIVRKDIPTGRLLWNAQQKARQRASLDLWEDLNRAGLELTDLVNSALAEGPIPEEETASAAQ